MEEIWEVMGEVLDELWSLDGVVQEVHQLQLIVVVRYEEMGRGLILLVLIVMMGILWVGMVEVIYVRKKLGGCEVEELQAHQMHAVRYEEMGRDSTPAQCIVMMGIVSMETAEITLVQWRLVINDQGEQQQLQIPAPNYVEMERGLILIVLIATMEIS
jgi:hypothetical protein